LNDERAAVPNGAEQWSEDDVADILRNDAYVGRWGGFGRIEEPLVDTDLWHASRATLTSH
jgi:hypothetical protein